MLLGRDKKPAAHTPAPMATAPLQSEPVVHEVTPPAPGSGNQDDILSRLFAAISSSCRCVSPSHISPIAIVVGLEGGGVICLSSPLCRNFATSGSQVARSFTRSSVKFVELTAWLQAQTHRVFCATRCPWTRHFRIGLSGTRVVRSRRSHSFQMSFLSREFWRRTLRLPSKFEHDGRRYKNRPHGRYDE